RTSDAYKVEGLRQRHWEEPGYQGEGSGTDAPSELCEEHSAIAVPGPRQKKKRKNSDFPIFPISWSEKNSRRSSRRILGGFEAYKILYFLLTAGLGFVSKRRDLRCFYCPSQELCFGHAMAHSLLFLGVQSQRSIEN